MAAETDIAWLAGFYEGEGCVSGSWVSRRRCRWQIAQNEIEPLERVEEILFDLGIPEKHIKFYTRGPTGIWVIELNYFEDIDIVCQAMWPWLSKRRKEQIKETMQRFLDSKTNHHRSKQHASVIPTLE